VRWLALAAALLAAATLPDGPPGIGVVAVAVLVAGAVAAARSPSPRAWGFAALALALVSFAALRDAPWVVAIDLTAAWLVGCVAVGGAGLPALAAPFVRLADAPALAPSAPAGIGAALRGVVLGGVLVVPFAALFTAADAAFAELGGRIPFPSLGSLPERAAVFALALAATLGLALAARRPPKRGEWHAEERLSPIEWAIPLGALVALFTAFVGVQLAVLFGGHDHVLETAGLTYAEYAREGFAELVVAGLLTLGVIAVAAAFAQTPSRRDRLLLRSLLGALCVLTLVIVASALHRLDLYEDAFGLTRARLAAEALALWLGGAFLLVLVAGSVARARAHLSDLAVAGSALALIAFSLVDPDARIAERNVVHWRETGRIDVAYLSGLSADAVPELMRLPEPLQGRVLLDLSEELAEDEPWSSANLSRARARDALRAQPRSAAPARSRSRRPLRSLPVPRASGTGR
jgi:Domain of unknown function (DUF4173)